MKKAVKKAEEDKGWFEGSLPDEKIADNWNPVHIGDPYANKDERPRLNHGRAALMGLLGAALGTGTAYGLHTLINRKSRLNHEWGRKMAWMIAAGLAGASIGYGGSLLRQFVHGNPFDYKGYANDEKGDYQVVMGGGSSSPHNEKNHRAAFDGPLGKGHYAMFNYNDTEAFRKWAAGIPKGSRLWIQGQSKGGPAAWKAAQIAGSLGLDVVRLDTMDNVGYRDLPAEKPKGVGKWVNWYPAARDYNGRQGVIGSVISMLRNGEYEHNGDLIADFGRAHGYEPGATENRMLLWPAHQSHSTVVRGALAIASGMRDGEPDENDVARGFVNVKEK